ncbi:MAG: tol-pal system-associated acyl-CoA thioesterase, partial [Acidiferrobacterales bacterium]
MSTFSIPVRVYYEDTDAAGVVYYANYLRFMERARTEWLRSLGFEQDELLRRDGVVFAVRSANLEFIKAARFNDILEVDVVVTTKGKASVTLKQMVMRGDELICSAVVRLACVDSIQFIPKP